MKKLLAVLVAIAGLHISILAQPTFSIASGSGAYENGEEICLDVIIDDFTDISFFTYAVTWDPAILELTDVRGFNLEQLTEDNFDLTSTENGVLVVNWEDATAEGVTVNTRSLEDNFSIYQLCFRTTDQCGGATKVDINLASSDVRRVNVNGSIGMFDQDADIVVGGQPITIVAGEVQANPEEIVCVPVTALNFNNATSVQFTIRWDTAVATFSGVEFNSDFPFLSLANFNTRRTDEGLIMISWADVVGSGVTVDDDTKYFDLCFAVASEGGVSTPLEFISNPTPIEITSSTDGAETCNTLTDGRIFVNEEPGAVTIKSASETVKPGDTVCVDVTVSDFFAVTEMKLSIGWDASILRFESIEDISLRSLDESDFNLDNFFSGIITLDWSDETGVLLEDDTKIFSLCFTAIGPVGSSTQVAFTDAPQPPFVRTTIAGDQNAGLNTRSGTVSILPPESLNLNATNATVSPGEEFCVDVQVENFAELVSLDYSMGWETTLIEFVSVTNFGVPGLDESDFDLANAENGLLTVDWASETFAGETLEDGAVLYSICFRVKETAQLGLCNAIFFSDIPAPISAVTVNSNGNSIEVTDQGNDICIFDEGGLTISMLDPIQVSPDSSICIPIDVSNFNDLTTLQFSMNWNPSVFEFVGINPTGDLAGLALSNFELTLSDIGVIGMTWNSDDVNGVTIADGTTIFELCLKAVGERLSCTQIDISSTPSAFEVRSSLTGDENLSLNPLNGEACILDALFLEGAFPLQPSCPDSENGAIELLVSGGDSNYSYSWSNGSFDPIITNLAAGTYYFTVTDGLGLAVQDSVVLEARSASPIANAQDANLSCGASLAQISGLGSTVGQNIVYDWAVIDGDISLQSDGVINPLVLVSTSGTMTLTVTNDSTTCSAIDTVQITKSDDPVVNAGIDQSITCETEIVTLDATSGTETGDQLSYNWITEDGLIEGDSTSLIITVSEPGLYILIVNHEDGCISRDSVMVEDLRGNITADAGSPQILNCSGDPVMLDGSASTAGEGITAEWSVVEEGGVLPTPTNEYMVEAFNPGTYVLTITNTLTACVATDTVVVQPDEELPIIQSNFIDELDCQRDSVTLSIRVSNVSDFSVRWLKDGMPLGAPLDTMLTPIVTEPGTYEVIVTNNLSGCTASRNDIVVNENITTPIASITGETILSCADTASVFLNSAGSSTGETYIANWSAAIDSIILIPRGDMAEVFEPGVYYLDVTEITSGCTTRDSVVVSLTDDIPVANVVQPSPVPCTGGTTQIDASQSSLGDYDWTVLEGDGNIIAGINSDVVTVDGPGLYQLRVTNALGCTSIDTARVTQSDTTSIEVSLEASTTDLTCLTPSAQVSISATPADGNYEYVWIYEEEQETLDITSNSAELTDPGLYFIDVIETNLNCTRREIFVLNRDVAVSQAIINDTVNLELDCIGTEVALDGSLSEITAIETAQWTGPDGADITNADNLVASTLTAGEYTLLITNTDNGCQDSTSVMISSASDISAIIDTPDTLTCTTNTIQLNGFGSTQGQDITYEWIGPEGVDFTISVTQQSAIIEEPGTYTLMVVNQTTQCSATTSVTVESDTVEPNVDAGSDIDLGCGGGIMIGGAGTDLGDIYNYAWTINESEVSNGAAQITVETPGTYVLNVLNTQNGCTASDAVLVTQMFQLESADAGGDQTTCENDAFLMANIPANASGVWTSVSGNIDNTTTSEISVDGLNNGDNLFIWTLSTNDCPSYSSDTVNVFVELAPVANNDVATFEIGKEDTISIRVTANDNLLNIGNVNTSITTKPSIGEIAGFDGQNVRYTARTIKNEQDQFTYTVCNANCPAICDSAVVNISIEVPDDGSNPLLNNLPNAITPNGDGDNETLYFDILDSTADFPDNEIIIFNRWGDIVYEQEPYNNNWSGVNNSGSELPQATYYYILRLDVANGIILVGDVTILK